MAGFNIYWTQITALVFDVSKIMQTIFLSEFNWKSNETGYCMMRNGSVLDIKYYDKPSF